MEELIGKKVIGLSVNEDQSILVFKHPKGEKTMYKTFGDCCSQTWFADIIGVKALLNEVVLTCEELGVVPVDDGRCRQEEDQFYGVKLTTQKGYIDIVYRNSSNGFYGGGISLFNGNKPKKLTNITDDWSA